MSTLNLRRAVLVTVSLFVLALTCVAQESLRELARSPRPGIPTSRRVITNDDIPPRPEPQRAAAAKSEDAKSDAAAPDSAKAEDGDTKQAAADGGSKVTDPEVRGEIERLQKAEAALEQKLQNIKEKLATEPDEFRRRMWADALDNQRITLEQYKKLREQLEKTGHQSAKSDAS